MSNIHVYLYAALSVLLAFMTKKYFDLSYQMEEMQMDCYPHPILSKPHDSLQLKSIQPVNHAQRSEDSSLTSSSVESLRIDDLGATRHSGFDHAQQMHLTGTDFVQEDNTQQNYETGSTTEASKMSQNSAAEKIVPSVVDSQLETDYNQMEVQKPLQSKLLPSTSDLESRVEKQEENLTQVKTRIEVRQDEVETSAWCHGSEFKERLCHFHNLCYYPLSNNFIFFHGKHSLRDHYESPLVQMSSVTDYNSHNLFLVDFLSKTAKQFEINWIEQTSLILHRFKPDNIMHVLHDDILPLHFTLSYLRLNKFENIDAENAQLVFMEDWEPGEYVDLYNLFSHLPPLYRQDLNQSEMVCFKNAYVGLSKMTTWYQYGYLTPQGQLENSVANGNQIRHTVDYLLKHLRSEQSLDFFSSDFIVLLSRKENRLILNEAELMMSLTQEFGKKVLTLSFETHSLKDMVNIIRNSIGIVGMHGSLLSLATFLKPGSFVIELYPYAVNPKNYTPFKTLAGLPAMDLVYRSWQNPSEDRSQAHPDNPPELGGFSGDLPVSVLEDIVQQTEVPEHLCCDDPSWLYHIYQDTEVKVKDIIDLVKSAMKEADDIKSSRNVLKLYPAPVTELICQEVQQVEETISEDLYEVSWMPPENIKDLQCKESYYEVRYVGDTPGSDGTFIVKDTTLTFNRTRRIQVWVRTVADNTRSGPYTYVECKASVVS